MGQPYCHYGHQDCRNHLSHITSHRTINALQLPFVMVLPIITGQQMNTLHLLIACDLGFALFVWWVYRDHNRKMDALYKKYDKDYSDRDRRIDGTDKN